MQPDRFTLKTQQAVQAAISLAHQRRNPQATPEHLLLALLDQEGGVVAPVLAKLGADANLIRTRLDSALAACRPWGRAARPRAPPASSSRSCTPPRTRCGRSRTSTSPPSTSSSRWPRHRSPAGDALREAGATKEALAQAVAEVRGPHRVTDPEAEDKYQALERFGRDLTRAAADGKLDPVIGRDDEIRRVDAGALAAHEEQPGAHR